MPEYIYRYHYEGSDYTTTIVADSKKEAGERLQRMPLAQYQGEVQFRVPAALGGGIIVRIVCLVRNFIHSLKHSE